MRTERTLPTPPAATASAARTADAQASGRRRLRAPAAAALAVLTLAAAACSADVDRDADRDATSQGDRGETLAMGDGAAEGDSGTDAFQDGGIAGSSDPVATVRAAVAALGEGDGAAACAYFSSDFAAEWMVDAAQDGTAADCAEAVTTRMAESEHFGAEYYGDDITTALVTDDFGDEVWVTVVWANEDDDLVWVLYRQPDGSWLVDNDMSDL